MDITPSLLKLDALLYKSLRLVTGRNLAAGQTPEEAELETDFAEGLDTALRDLYYYPLEGGGWTAVPQGSEAEVRRWALSQYREEAATAALLLIVTNYLRQGVNVGGAMALDTLGLPGRFNLTNAGIIRQIGQAAEQVATVGGSLSAVDTTAAELARQVTSYRQLEMTAEEMNRAWAAYVNGRVPSRAAGIATTEGVRGTRAGIEMTFGRNGITYEILRNQEGACPECQGYEGERFPTVDGMVLGVIPLHPACRCFYEPDTDGWEPPEDVWVGE